MILRAANPGDAKATGAILSAFVAATDWMPKLHSRNEDIGFCRAMIERGWMRVAEDETGVTGFIARNDCEVNALYVATETQGRGIGSALIREAQAKCARLTLWTFQDNLGARRFYAQHGFFEIARSDGQTTDEKLPDVQLEWQRQA